MINIAIAGASGRMGQFLLREAFRHPEVKIAGALTRPGNPLVGQDVGMLIGDIPFQIDLSDNAEKAFSNADVVIDFSKPEGLETHLKAAQALQKPYVAALTGLKEAHKIKLKKASFIIPLLEAPNLSLAMAVLKRISMIAAKAMGPSYDVSILEMHHRHKADAPSGSALSFAEELASLPHLKQSNPPYSSVSPRPTGTIEIATLRGGENVCDHEVIFAGKKDTLRLEHRTSDRSLYAEGALTAAFWLKEKAPGLYTMDDIVEFPQ